MNLIQMALPENQTLTTRRNLLPPRLNTTRSSSMMLAVAYLLLMSAMVCQLALVASENHALREPSAAGYPRWVLSVALFPPAPHLQFALTQQRSSRRLPVQRFAISSRCTPTNDIKPFDLIEADGLIDHGNCPKRRTVGHHHRLQTRCIEPVALPDLNRGLRCAFREETDSHDPTTQENRTDCKIFPSEEAAYALKSNSTCGHLLRVRGPRGFRFVIIGGQ